MDAKTFDLLARWVSSRTSRRAALAALLAGLIGPLPSTASAAKGGRAQHRGGRDEKGNGKGAQNGKGGHGRDNGRNRSVSPGQRGRKRRQPPARQTQAEAACFPGSPCIPGPGKNLGKCDFGGSSALRGKNLTGANLGGANLARADVSGANLSGANLDKACLVDANLSGATVNGSTNIATAILCRTTMPDRSTSNAGCTRGASCCSTCDAAHPCPSGQICCAGKCVSGACCTADDCQSRTCQNKACSGRQCVYTTVSGMAGPNCNGICCDGNCVSASSLCGGACGNVCTSQETCCGGTCVPTSTLCGGSCGNICQAGETCCGEKCTPTSLLCGGNCQNACPDTLTCCGQGLCQQCCGGDASTCRLAEACEQVTCEDGVCTFGPVRDGAPCEAGKATCCGGKCMQSETLCGGICGNVCAAPTPRCCGQICGECCTDPQCTNPETPFCLGFQCVDVHVVKIFEVVRGKVAELLGIEVDQITMESRFREDLGADSLDLVEIVIALEEEFGQDISDEDAEKITTVGEAVQYIVEHGG